MLNMKKKTWKEDNPAVSNANRGVVYPAGLISIFFSQLLLFFSTYNYCTTGN